MIKRYCIIAFVFLISMSAKAQYYDAGQDSDTIKWEQINTAAFKIVYPNYYQTQAKRIAQILDSVPTSVMYTVGGKVKQIPLVLHPQSVLSNGMVVWAPRRMEWWTCPPQDIYSQSWFEQLGIHEYRHVMQMESLYQGFSGVLISLFGEHIIGLISGLLIPNWFFEGDATVAETALSNAGRGRSANFQMKLRAQIQEKGIYSYNKALMGSYKDFVPNHYDLGYHLVSFGREKYGYQLWQNTLKNVAKRPGQLNPFERAITKNTSYRLSRFYFHAMEYHDSVWQTELQPLQENTKPIILTPQVNTYTQYYSPKFLNNDSVLSLKNSFEETSSFVLFTSNSKEEKIRHTGSIYDNYFNHCNGKLIWCEAKKHSRWANVSYSNLVLYDLKTNKREQLSTKTRYFSPNFSPSGKEIVLIEDDIENKSKILLVNLENSTTTQITDGGYETFFSYPTFSEDAECIYVIALQHKGKSIRKIHLKTAIIEECKEETKSNISHLLQKGEYLFYIADYSGISQVYALHLTTKQEFQITHALYGVSSFDLLHNAKSILYTSYTRNGYRLEKADVLMNTNRSLSEKPSYPVAEKLTEQEPYLIHFSTANPNYYNTRKYSKLGHLFNFHSWAPMAIDPVEQVSSLGVSFMSQNTLSTSFLETGFAWNTEEDKGSIYVDYTYKGFYPIISTTASYSGRQMKVNKYSLLWNEFVWATQLKLPFDYNKENHFYGISPYLYYEYKKMFPIQNFPYTIENNQSIRTGFSLYHQLSKAYKQIYPSWAQTATVNINKSFNKGNNSWLFSIYGKLFFPGIINTHSISTYSGYQYNHEGSIQYSNQVSLARGYNSFIAQSLFSNKLNYTMPLLYPDFSVGKALYIKRIYTTLFYDFMWYKGTTTPLFFDSSVGSELNFNMNVFRLETPINTGVRISYLQGTNSFSYDFLFSISF